jgi:SAM-dependent methyltransferase
MKVDPNNFWKEKGKTYYQNFDFDNEQIRYQEQIVMNYLKNNFSENEIRTVFEIGCGFGRFTRLILEAFKHIELYHAIDLSLDQIEYARNFVNDDRVYYIQESIQDHRVIRKYDLLFAAEVFFQIQSEDIELAFSKALLLTEKHLVHLDPKQQNKRDGLLFYDDDQNIQEFAFFHDYDSLISKSNIIIKSHKYTEVERIHQAIYHVIMKP